MNIIIESSLKTLNKTKLLLDHLDDNLLCEASVPPYHSSIGNHIRHILDFYGCIFNVSSNNKVDLTARSRNKDVASDCECAQNYLDSIIQKLNTELINVTDTILVIDDLGMGKSEIHYTFGALLAQANSHTIHHYAIINYILEGLKISFDDSEFGYNPTTPKETSLS
ncbi:DinB family protein [Thalassobellus suaedae]|uniref:DinB-like domain-containing protein n=1 Tax=Thalassobellus suaedae TaxID=3074124 RepID=A0ABY9XNT9_9FLAO|nr:hypothetical protein RHP51_09985 [Flavobacteriaceae bacterium HL-DH14]WNH12848.1 hypothetical protein RHP49_00980 [Flavobacteriaceae bacterium HL-DH10]